MISTANSSSVPRTSTAAPWCPQHDAVESLCHIRYRSEQHWAAAAIPGSSGRGHAADAPEAYPPRAKEGRPLSGPQWLTEMQQPQVVPSILAAAGGGQWQLCVGGKPCAPQRVPPHFTEFLDQDMLLQHVLVNLDKFQPPGECSQLLMATSRSCSSPSLRRLLPGSWAMPFAHSSIRCALLLLLYLHPIELHMPH